MIPTRHPPFGMLLTHIFKHFHVSFSGETYLPPTVSIDRTFLKRMHAITHASRAHEQPAPPPQHDLGSSFTSSDLYVSMLNQMSSLSLGQTTTNALLKRVLSNQDELRATQMELRAHQNEYQEHFGPCLLCPSLSLGLQWLHVFPTWVATSWAFWTHSSFASYWSFFWLVDCTNHTYWNLSISWWFTTLQWWGAI